MKKVLMIALTVMISVAFVSVGFAQAPAGTSEKKTTTTTTTPEKKEVTTTTSTPATPNSRKMLTIRISTNLTEANGTCLTTGILATYYTRQLTPPLQNP